MAEGAPLARTGAISVIEIEVDVHVLHGETDRHIGQRLRVGARVIRRESEVVGRTQKESEGSEGVGAARLRERKSGAVLRNLARRDRVARIHDDRRRRARGAQQLLRREVDPRARRGDRGARVDDAEAVPAGSERIGGLAF